MAELKITDDFPHNDYLIVLNYFVCHVLLPPFVSSFCFFLHAIKFYAYFSRLER